MFVEIPDVATIGAGGGRDIGSSGSLNLELVSVMVSLRFVIRMAFCGGEPIDANEVVLLRRRLDVIGFGIEIPSFGDLFSVGVVVVGAAVVGVGAVFKAGLSVGGE